MGEVRPAMLGGEAVNCHAISTFISDLEREDLNGKLSLMSKLSSRIEEACSKKDTEAIELCYQINCHVFLSAEPKNPLKQYSSRSLMKFPPEYRSEIIKYLSVKLIEVMKNNSLFRERHSLNKICDFFDNFPIGVDAISLCLKEVLQHICQCLRYTLENLSGNLSPMEQNELIMTTHSALRGAVTVLQKFGSRIKLLVENNGGDEKKCVDDILYSCSEFLNHELIPMDSKLNCGLIVVILFSVMYDKGYDLVMSKLMGSYSSTKGMILIDNINFKSKLAQMSACYGLLNIMPLEDLCKCDISGKKYFVDAVIKKLLALSESTDNNLCLGCSRALQQAVQILHTGAIKSCSPDCLKVLENTDILMLCLDFVWVSLDHYVDCVRHAAKTILHYLLQIADFMHNKDKSGVHLGDVIINMVGKLPSYKKSKYIALAVLANEFGFQKLRVVFPDVVSTLLEVLEDPSMSSHASNAYEMLMVKNFKEENEAKWVLTWIFPLFDTYHKSNVGYIVESIIAKAMAVCPALLDHILSTLDDGTVENSKLKVVMVCLKIGARQGLLEKMCSQRNDPSMWKGIIKYETLMLALVSCDNEVRLDALSLIVESNKTTQRFDVKELELVKCFLWYNINCDGPSLKQKNLMLQKKVLTRIRESAYPFVKIINSKNVNETQVAEARKILQEYSKFLDWLYNFCFKCLFPGANATRRASALEILVLLDGIFSTSSNQSVEDGEIKLFSLKGNEDFANLLLISFKDSFESSKNLAFSLLTKFPAENLSFKDRSWINEHLSVGLKLASSVKPPDCITAAYLLKFVASLPEAETLLTDKAISIVSPEYSPDFSVIGKESNFHQRNIFCMIWILFEQLKREYAVAAENLLLAAGSGPIYGTLFSIRYLLKILDWKAVAENPLWKSLILELISLCFKINEAVIHVVNSSSPEGHLPMDFEPAAHLSISSKPHVPNMLCNKNEVSGQNPPVTAQMVLLCSWRTVKEVSLFLGEISFHAPIQKEVPGDNDECHLLSEELVLRIGEHFTKLLSETKHRGAFEQAYVGFCQLCKKLWRHPSGILSALPKTWLKGILGAITKGKESSKLCATRRSAGVPFIVQALVTTQIDVRQPTALKEAMDILLGLLERRGNENDDETSEKENEIESRTHAMNILRALFRHTLLGEFVTPYVARGVMASIKGFKGHTWAERNSATLLFGALVIRIFGVKHSHDDMHRRNRMTGRVFFERYPLLYDFILEELKLATMASPVKGASHTSHPALCLHRSLFPLLVLLSRLYPSSLEGTDSNMQLSAFIPPLRYCLKSNIYKIRELAARATVPLITSTGYISHLDEAFDDVMRSEEQNLSHGILMEISMLLLEVPYPQKENAEVLSKKVEPWISGTMKILSGGSKYHNIVKEAYVRVLRYLLFISSSAVGSSFPRDLWDKIRGVLDVHIKNFNFSTEMSKCQPELAASTWIQRSTQILLEIAVIADYSPEMVVKMLCSLLDNSGQVPCVTVTLSFINSIFGEESSECDEEEDGLPLFEWPRTNAWIDKVQKHKTYFLKDRSLAFSTVKFLLHNTHSHLLQKALKVVGYLAISSLSVEWKKVMPDSGVIEINPFSYLVDLCQSQPENVGRSALFCLSALVHKVVGSDLEVCLTSKTGTVYCDLLIEFSSADKSERSRMVVAEAMVKNHQLLYEKAFNVPAWDHCRALVVLLDLLGDHSRYVRETAAKISESFDFSEAHQKCLHGDEEKSSRRSSTVERCFESPEMPIQDQYLDISPERLKELVISHFCRVFGSLNKYECVITLLVLILRDEGCEEGDDSMNEERVFDKGEANLYGEWLPLAKLCAQLLSEILDDSVVRDCSPIPASVMSLVGLEGSEASTVLDLLELVISRINEKIEACEKMCGMDLNPFLTPGYDAILKEAFKVGLALTSAKKNSYEMFILSEGFFNRLTNSKILSTFALLCE
ncbi:thyroid adenoma-associated protein homolog [Ischnura elegans]|uniref:thyroid adenoma-associated protein homolog n=1 Tax=Ischnura elegans TaxID=197161 RepID=UPI001ED880C5|nr:thyroid adenoma-associated protein homolog [Ischnura elegans]XP_046382613.1 thyroid adenoma-associated protein homolog [Ischnura elegans]XP_046382614.1 thyroid adenoma-associated protein homolog [Ischnura elegans]XP_046382615.1 thyroid adenoma-associated protein homolog [Ischnura elegans]XP_046382616.1 thyroid adenoma-associated protein homolog [Ischnura elegans]